jgi:CHAD domain-containing protein
LYFDTGELDLARHGVTLRRRTGGLDAGWHLKLPYDTDIRTELHLPLDDGTETVPEELLDPVRALVRDRPLVPIARLSTRRLQHPLTDDKAVVLAQVCDDRVHAERLHPPDQVQDWREWEVELVDGDQTVLDRVEQRLLDAGAGPTSSTSKLFRCLGEAVPPARTTLSRKQLSRASAAQVLIAYLSEQVAELHRQDGRLRADSPGSVHKLRIAARRVRSALKTYRPLFEPGATDEVGDELRWLGSALGDARDAQVLRERLHLMVAAEPPELVLGPVLTRIDDELRTVQRDGREQAVRSLGSERYFRLLDALDELVQSPPLLPEADEPASRVLPRLLKRDAKRLRHAVDEIARTETPQQHDVALHEARKKAKRLRYGAESAVPVFGGRAKALAASTKKVQQRLGEHQDTVMSRTTLREYGVRAHLNGENGFTFGRLHALEQTRADQTEREFEEAWAALPIQHLRRRLRK